MRSSLVAASFALALCVAAPASADVNIGSIQIVNFHTVTANAIYRGARPTDAGVQALANAGFKTVLDLEDATDVVAHERSVANNAGLTFVSAPMSGFWYPNDNEVNQIEAIVANPAYYPIFIHCQHGQDRAGLIVGIERVENEGWSPAQAYSEMLNLGFHKILVFLNHYYEVKTGFED